MRKRLPETRIGITRKASVGGMEYYATVNFYPDSADPGEIFVVIAKEGSTIAGFVDALAVTISVALQHGVPWEILGEKYLHTIFDPRDDNASSLVDGLAQTISNLVELRKGQLNESTNAE